MTREQKAVLKWSNMISDEISYCSWCKFPNNTHNIGMTHDNWMQMAKDMKACAAARKAARKKGK